MNWPSTITTTSPSSEVASAVQQLTDTAALTALLRYEQNHKDRAGAVTGIENRLAALAEQDISRN